MKTENEIYSLIDDAMEAQADGSKYGGMSYEDGIEAACQWILGNSDEYPTE